MSYHFFTFDEVIVESVNFITDVKIEYKTIITMMENNYFFKKLTSKHRAKRKMCLYLYYSKKRRIPIYITKTTLRTSKNQSDKCHIQHEES